MNLKNMQQTKDAKAQYDDRGLIEFLLNEKPRTKQELAEMLHCGNRAARNIVAELRMYYPVISYSNRKGYSLPPKIEDISSYSQLIDIKNDIALTMQGIESRIEVLKKELKPLIAYISELDKKVVVE